VLTTFILILTTQWLFSFFGQNRFSHIPHSSGFIDTLAVVIFSLIAIKFLA